MPTPTYTPLATVTLGSSAASVTFSSIPATYRDLILVINGSSSIATSFPIRLNGDSGSNYPYVVMKGDAIGAVSELGTTSAIFATWNSTLANTPWTSVTQIMDYSATDKHKTALTRVSMTRETSSLYTAALATRWANTAAVTSVACSTSTGTYNAGTTFSLYGVIA